MKALIVGAGIGGLAAGIALKQAGWQVSIHERAENPRELGFGLLLAPNAIAALGELGVADRVLTSGVHTSAVEIRRLDGRVVRRFRSPLGGASAVALRSELHGALMESVGRDALLLGSDADRFEAAGESVVLSTADGVSHAGDLLVGADGVGSAIRRQLHPDEPLARPSGYCAVRGVALGVGDVLEGLSAVGYLDDGVEIGTARASSDAVYWYISVISRDLGVADRNPAAVIRRLSDRCDRSLKTLFASTRPEDMRFDDLFTRAPLRRWGTGRVTLLGDAAHPVMPHTGQGAAQALEDAVALGVALRSGGATEEALRRYEQVREKRTRRFVLAGPRIARMTTTRNPIITAVRTLAIRALPEWLVSREP